MAAKTPRDLQTYALETLPFSAIRELNQRGVLSHVDPNFNAVEYKEICNYSDVNTVLYFASMHSLVNIAKLAAADGGQMLIINRRDFRHKLSRDMIEFIFKRHDNPNLHLSESIIDIEYDIIAYNAIINDDEWLLNRAGVVIDTVNNNITSDHRAAGMSRGVMTALIERGDVELLRNILLSHPYKAFFEAAITTGAIGRSGKWEMYELACEILLKSKKTKHPQCESIESLARLINDSLFYGALECGHFDLVQRLIDDRYINYVLFKENDLASMYSASDAYSHECFGASKYWRKILGLGFDLDIDAVLRGAIKHRNIDAVKYILHEEKYRDALSAPNLINHYITAAIESSSFIMVRYIDQYAKSIGRDECIAYNDYYYTYQNDAVVNVALQNNHDIIHFYHNKINDVFRICDLTYISSSYNITENTIRLIFSTIASNILEIDERSKADDDKRDDYYSDNRYDVDSMVGCLLHNYVFYDGFAATNALELFYNIILLPHADSIYLNWKEIAKHEFETRNSVVFSEKFVRELIVDMHMTPKELERFLEIATDNYRLTTERAWNMARTYIGHNISVPAHVEAVYDISVYREDV